MNVLTKILEDHFSDQKTKQKENRKSNNSLTKALEARKAFQLPEKHCSYTSSYIEVCFNVNLVLTYYSMFSLWTIMLMKVLVVVC